MLSLALEADVWRCHFRISPRGRDQNFCSNSPSTPPQRQPTDIIYTICIALSFISSLLQPSPPVILSSNMSAEQAAVSIPEESKEVELGPLPSVEGKSEDEVKELLGKAAKQGMFG